MRPVATRPAFDRRAAVYDKHADVQREAAAWLAGWLPAEIDGPALELGAGTGLFTRHLATRSEKVVATDVAPRMVRSGAAALPGAEWLVAEASALPRDHRYRWIFSSSLAQWLTDPTAAFRAWRDVTAPGARFLGGWFIRGTLADLYAVCPEAAPFPWRDSGEWLSMLRASGWKPVRHETRIFERHYPDCAAMLREMHNTGTVIPQRVPPARLRRALRSYDSLHHSEGGVTGAFRSMRVEAVRS